MQWGKGFNLTTLLKSFACFGGINFFIKYNPAYFRFILKTNSFEVYPIYFTFRWHGGVRSASHE
jgi:hypothetical protein